MAIGVRAQRGVRGVQRRQAQEKARRARAASVREKTASTGRAASRGSSGGTRAATPRKRPGVTGKLATRTGLARSGLLGAAAAIALEQDRRQGEVDRGERPSPKPGGRSRRDGARRTTTPTTPAPARRAPAPTARPNRSATPASRPRQTATDDLDYNKLTRMGYSMADINKMSRAEIRRKLTQ